MLILRTTDLVPCKIDELTVWVSPLSWADQSTLYNNNRTEKGEVKVDETKMLIETLRLSIKKVDGFKGHQYSDGSEIVLEFDDNKRLTDDSLECLIKVIGMVPVSYLSSAIVSNTLGDKITGWKIALKDTINTKKKS